MNRLLILSFCSLLTLTACLEDGANMEVTGAPAQQQKDPTVTVGQFDLTADEFSIKLPLDAFLANANEKTADVEKNLTHYRINIKSEGKRIISDVDPSARYNSATKLVSFVVGGNDTFHLAPYVGKSLTIEIVNQETLVREISTELSGTQSMNIDVGFENHLDAPEPAAPGAPVVANAKLSTLPGSICAKLRSCFPQSLTDLAKCEDELANEESFWGKFMEDYACEDETHPVTTLSKINEGLQSGRFVMNQNALDQCAGYLQSLQCTGGTHSFDKGYFPQWKDPEFGSNSQYSELENIILDSVACMKIIDIANFTCTY